MEAEEERDVENLFRPPDVERSRTLRLGLWRGRGGETKVGIHIEVIIIILAYIDLEQG